VTQLIGSAHVIPANIKPLGAPQHGAISIFYNLKLIIPLPVSLYYNTARISPEGVIPAIGKATMEKDSKFKKRTIGKLKCVSAIK
jgi:hypothetical protein